MKIVKNILVCSLLNIILSVTIYSQESFKIVFVADPANPNFNSTWLTKIATDWGATGVCLRVIWGDVDNNSTPGVDTWTNLDAAINTIANNQYNGKNLDIYIRVSMGVKKPSWVSLTSGNFSNNDFQIKYDGTRVNYQDYVAWTVDEARKYPLNFTSTTSKGYMNNFFTAVIVHLDNTFSSIKSRIKEVVPSFSTDEESEYPYFDMCGYSTLEISAFQSYLQNVYSSASSLNQKWNPNNTWTTISSWTDINPKNYNWNSTNNVNYLYPIGRTEWMNFRTKQLSDFISTLKSIADLYSFQMGIQFGSIYDSGIEVRGWVDPTKLIEKVNSVHVADIYQYADNFSFGADYLRSICKFWTTSNSMATTPIRFSTETNWPGYNGQTASFLSQKWTEQLVSYYNKGASEHYLFGWDISTSDLDSYKTTYSVWRNTLLNYSNDPLITVSNQNAVHLGCEKVLFNNHNQQSASGRFAIYDSLTAQPPYSLTFGNYDGNKDIVTNYMIEKNSTYLNNYSTFYFTKISQYITDKAYLGLMKSGVTIAYINATWFSDNGHGEFAFTQGLKNEYNELRSPIHLIWRSRPDLIAIWPDANLPSPGSGYSSDFVSWAYNNGCGYSNQPSAREYPGWEIRDNGSTGNYKYDKNLRTVWNERTDLQSVFINAHNNVNNTWNIISWAKSNGYQESTLLSAYNNWPYIGNESLHKSSDIIISKEIPQEFNLSQNYPNPFNPVTKINFSIQSRDNVSLKIYDIIGREIVTLIDEIKEPGTYSVTFDGSTLSSGIYIYTLSSSTQQISKKLMLVK